MNQTEIIQKRMANPTFFGKRTMVDTKNLPQAPAILAKCQELLLLASNDTTRALLQDIITNTSQIVQQLQEQRENPYNHNHSHTKHPIRDLCKELQVQTLCLPPKIQPESNLATTSYKIAVACFYLLALSAALAVGAAFGAAYFGFFSTSYFVDTLVIALSMIGIPAAGLGLFSYGVHCTQDLSQKGIQALTNDVDSMCADVLYKLDLVPRTEEEPEVIYPHSLK